VIQQPLRPANPTVTIKQAIRWGSASLAAVGISSPRLEARLLLAHATRLTVADLLRDPTANVSSDPFITYVDRRRAHEPLAYIVGHREFWSLDFAVSPATLIPRPDSETIVEAALAACPRPRRILDLGTGTGCLLLSLLHERPMASGFGTDLSQAATSLAKRNAKSLGLLDRAAFICCTWAEPLAGAFDLIVSNPPYISSGEIDGLMPDVAAFEPRLALDGGSDGLDAYRRIVADLPRLLAPGGTAVVELGVDQADQVALMAQSGGFAASFRTDLAGVRRVAIMRTGHG
jgi:release factor glutamine methyltransferase